MPRSQETWALDSDRNKRKIEYLHDVTDVREDCGTLARAKAEPRRNKAKTAVVIGLLRHRDPYDNPNVINALFAA